jgi:hypothetical protein
VPCARIMANITVCFEDTLSQLQLVCAEQDSAWIQRKRKIDTFAIIRNMIASTCGSYGGMRSSVLLSQANFSADALCKAKQRMPVSVLQNIHQRLKGFGTTDTAPNILAVDGSKVALGQSLTLQNRSAFPKYSNSKDRPHALISCIYNCTTGHVQHADVYNHHNERAAILEQLTANDCTRRGDVLVFDRGY